MKRRRLLARILVVFVLLDLIAFYAYFKVERRHSHANPAAESALIATGIDPNRIGQTVSLARTSYSGGTHLASYEEDGEVYGDAIDISPAESRAACIAEVHRLRLAGFAAWWRGPDSPGGHAPEGQGPHYHIVWAGHLTRNVEQREQIISFIHHFRGLARLWGSEAWATDGRHVDPTITPEEVHAVQRAYRAVYPHDELSLKECYEARHVAG